MKRNLRLFWSYAHKDSREAGSLFDLLGTRLRGGKEVAVVSWMDTSLLPGEDWLAQIEVGLDDCDGGVLLLSPSFLVSGFCVGKEVARMLEGRKVLLPLLLKPVDFGRTEMHGLERYQVFGGNQPAECRAFTRMDRDEYTHQAFQKIYDRLMKEFVVV